MQPTYMYVYVYTHIDSDAPDIRCNNIGRTTNQEDMLIAGEQLAAMDVIQPRISQGMLHVTLHPCIQVWQPRSQTSHAPNHGKRTASATV